jgi:sugar lactone lactonase YvrE
VASQNTSAQGLEFNNDGTKLFVIDNEPTEEVYQYDLTTGFDISTASYSNIKLDVSSEDSTTFGISFNADGSKMYLAGQDTDYIYQYSTAGSSLTAGQSYYVQTDGTLGTTAADPSVFAGTAVSATKLIVKG